MTVLVDLATVPAGRTVALVVAQDPAPPPGKGDEFGKASPVGLVVVLLLLIATAFLVRSMTKHLRRVPASFDDQAGQPPGADSTRSAPPADAAGPPKVDPATDR